MSEPKVNSLNLAEWIARHRRTTSAMRDGASGVEQMHRAIDCACADRALQLVLTADPGQTDPAELAWVRCRALWEHSRWDEVRALAESIPSDQLREPGHLRVLVRAAWTDLLRADLQGEFITAVERLRPWIVQGNSLVHLADLAHLDAYRSLVFDDDPEAAAREARLAVSLYAHLGENAAEIKSRIFAIRVLAIEGHLAAARDEARQCVETARQAGHPRLLVQALNAEATVAWRRGDWDVALDGYDTALRLAEEFDDTRWRVAVAANRARALAFRGRTEEAELILRDLDSETVTVAGVLDEYRGQVALLAADPARALECFDRALRCFEADGVQSYERAEVLLRKAEAHLALEEYDLAEACADEGLERLSRYTSTLERGHLLHVRARVRMMQGRPQEAVADLGGAIAELRRTGDQWALLRALMDRAACPGTEATRCVSDATEARALAAHLGHEDLAEQARRRLVRAEARVHPAGATAAPEGVVADCPAMRALLADARLAAASKRSVLLQGETGTGKEVLARFVHEHSPRRGDPFVAVNCAAIPESLFEREVFGHARGAFTGADREGRGLVEEADGGTLFLDEVGELPVALQPKLLRLLEEGSYRRVGETSIRHIDLRVISATNRPLRDAVGSGGFRDDLFYRLGAFELHLPPLRERGEDLVPLVMAFLARESGGEIAIDRAAWKALRSYSWPGNVRELESAIGSACVRARMRGVIRPEHLPAALRSRPKRPSLSELDLQRAVRRTERDLILQALARTRFRRSDAAQLLGIGRNTLYEKMRKLGIRPEPAA